MRVNRANKTLILVIPAATVFVKMFQGCVIVCTKMNEMVTFC